MKRILKILVIFLLLFIFLTQWVLAGHLTIEGWEIIESKGKVFLLQKKEREYLSEAMLNLSVTIGSDILKGYSIKKGGKIQVADYFNNSNPLGLWKIIYNGFDSSGNVYLKIIREKDDLNNSDIDQIKERIERVSNSEGEKNIIEERLELFNNFIDNYLDKEGEVITIDPSKIVIISHINDLPPFKIEVNNKHSVINVTVASLD